MSLIETLNKLAHLPPDEIIKQISDPLFPPVRCRDITLEYWQSLPEDLEFCFLRFKDHWDTESPPIWDGGDTTQR
jgi:hypothetical protein